MSETASASFTYDTNLTPQITSLSPNSVTGVGESRVLRIKQAFMLMMNNHCHKIAIMGLTVGLV